MNKIRAHFPDDLANFLVPYEAKYTMTERMYKTAPKWDATCRVTLKGCIYEATSPRFPLKMSAQRQACGLVLKKIRAAMELPPLDHLERIEEAPRAPSPAEPTKMLFIDKDAGDVWHTSGFDYVKTASSFRICFEMGQLRNSRILVITENGEFVKFLRDHQLTCQQQRGVELRWARALTEKTFRMFSEGSPESAQP